MGIQTWFDAALQVLTEVGPLSAPDIVREIERRQLRAITGRTPEATVAAVLYTAIQDGDPRVRLAASGLFEFGVATSAPTTTSLGRLERVEPRTIWADEARNFTPWLLANAGYLGDVLGIELELEHREHPVGQYFLDLYGRDVSNQCVLIVENQLTPTDHKHLGQLLTYAAGTEPPAGTIVWIAPEFRDEHKEALEFLNARVVGERDRQIRFFGVEMGVVRIGTSVPAPQFTVVAAPSEWSEQRAEVQAAASGGGRAQQYRAFWARYLKELNRAAPGITKVRTARASNWVAANYLRSGISLNLAFIGGARVSTEIYIDLGEKTKNLDVYFGLLDNRSAIEADLGVSLEWQELPEKQACRVRLTRAGEITDESCHEDLIEWFIRHQMAFKRIFRPLVDALPDELWTHVHALSSESVGELGADQQ